MLTCKVMHSQHLQADEDRIQEEEETKQSEIRVSETPNHQLVEPGEISPETKEKHPDILIPLPLRTLGSLIQKVIAM